MTDDEVSEGEIIIDMDEDKDKKKKTKSKKRKLKLETISYQCQITKTLALFQKEIQKD